MKTAKEIKEFNNERVSKRGNSAIWYFAPECFYYWAKEIGNPKEIIPQHFLISEYLLV